MHRYNFPIVKLKTEIKIQHKDLVFFPKYVMHLPFISSILTISKYIVYVIYIPLFETSIFYQGKVVTEIYNILNKEFVNVHDWFVNNNY